MKYEFIEKQAQKTNTQMLDLGLTSVNDKLAYSLSPAEIALHMPLITEIEKLKKKRNAVILAHTYQLPEIYHGIADFVGDSLGLAIEAQRAEADVIVQCGVYFMAETSKILNPHKKVLIPDTKAGCSLADSITAADVQLLRQKYPNVPIVTYVNTTAEVKAQSDICCTSANAKKIIESLGVNKVICLPDEFLAKNIAKQLPHIEVITWNGKCEVHERFNASDIDEMREIHEGIKVVAHPECPPEVVEKADFTGSTTAMSQWVSDNAPHKVVLLTECSMSDNIAVNNPKVNFIRPCNMCPHMKRITLEKVRDCLLNDRFEVQVNESVASKARNAVENMINCT